MGNRLTMSYKSPSITCIAIDIGNTSVAIARWQNGKVSRIAHIDGGIRRSPDACEQAILKAAKGGVNGVCIASVVPKVNSRWKTLCRRVLGCTPLFVTADLTLPLDIDYPKCRTIGADRLADAVGAIRRYGAPVLIADFGTALTFDVVTSKYTYIGGVITPGIPLMTDYLHEKTAQLPKVSLDQPCGGVGRSTEEAIRIGARIGYRGLIREIVAHLAHETKEDFRLVATGGYAKWVLDKSGLPFTIDPDLTLYGIGVIFAFPTEIENWFWELVEKKLGKKSLPPGPPAETRGSSPS